MGRLSLLAVSAVLAGCGPALAPGFDGLWSGNVTASFAGLSAISYQTLVRLKVSGDAAEVRGLCPDGSGSLLLSGDETRAEWRGVYSCPPIAISDCAAVTISYASASVELAADGSLRAQALGLGRGCTTQREFTLVFTGWR